jgi:Spermine/spermidine synthase domain
MPRPFHQTMTLRARMLRGAARIGVRFADWQRSSAGTSFCGGTLAGLYGVAFCHQMFARFGGGLIVSGGTAAAVALGLLAASIGRRQGSRSVALPIAAALIPAVWALANGWLADGIDLACQSLTLDVLASPLGQFAVALGTALLLLGIPAACAARLVFRNPALGGSWVCAGAAAGCLVAAYGIGPWFGAQWAGLIAAGLTVAWVARLAHSRRQTATAAPAETRDARVLHTAMADAERREPVLPASPTGPEFARILVGSVAAGLIAGALSRLVQQLVPGTEAIEWTVCAGFLLGAAATWRIVRGQSDEGRLPRGALVMLVAALGCALPIVLFRPLTDVLLAVTATLSNVSLLMMARGAIASMALFAAGAIWAAGVGSRATRSRQRRGESAANLSEAEGTNGHPALLVYAIPAFLAGLVGARWLVLLEVPLPLLVTVSALVPATFALASGLRSPAVGGKRTLGAAWTAIVVIFLFGLFARTYEPSRAARLLFSTNVFMAWRDATESRLLPFLDDSRLLVEREGECGTYTLWKQRGVQFALRESGIPRGVFCPQPEIGPQFSGEVMPCILPLVLHEAPRHILILGLGSGSGLAACLEFPIEDVTCVESDRSLIGILESTVWPTAQGNPNHDNRARVVCAEPTFAVRARGGMYDVVYADSGQSGVSQGTAQFTREFYAAAAKQLATDGIFAQRFQQIDFGPWPLESALATLRSVFSHVAAIEIAPGELALLATQSARGLDRPNLLERFQTPQARRTLARLGWDWSVVLNLAAYAGDGSEAVSRGASINTSANSLFAFRLPQETMRWGPKNQELVSALSPHAGRIAQWPRVNGNDPELLRRLSDVVRQHDLMTSYPDQPWAYRKLVQEELKKHPHTTIEESESGFERRLDAVDRRRVDYFTALGQVARRARPTPESLRRVEEFAEPFDPVLTYFLHHELAAFYARSAAAGSMAQLQHRLYTVYYADPRDRSVRDVVDALEILIREPQIVASDQRWDYLNALLAFLETRWLNRGLIKPTSAQIVLNDLERSIDAVESTLATMDQLRSTVGIREADWSARRSVLERALVRPLRSYRAELIPVYQQEKEKTASSEDSEPRPSAN